MKTIEVKLYKFSELSEDAQQKAIEKLCDINVDYDWWESAYEDAENIGLKITGFDIGRGRNATGEFIFGAYEVANKILKEHGKTCETHKTASQFIKDWDLLVEKYSDGINKNRVSEDNEYEFDGEADDLEHEFLNSLLEDYAMMLEKDYEYQTSKEAIIETIEANEYDFTEDGKLY